jgi:hypothetical protein
VVLAVACGGKKDEPPPTKGSDTTTPPKGSDTSMKGSDSGSAKGSDSGSGSAMAGSGSGSADAAGSGSAVATNDFDFDKLTHEQKVDFMKKKVMPAMKKAFQDFDPKAYAKFTCNTCHGKDPKAKKFKMPNNELPKLDFAALKAGKQKPKVAEWMGKVIKPEMAKLLNQPEYSESNPKGFGCLECHEQKK